MPKSDGSVIIDTRVNTQGFSQGAAGLKSQFGRLAGAAGKLGVAIAAAFSVKEIIAFSKEAISLGSDLQEVQNVVDVTFSTMNEQVNEFAKNAYKTAGLSETMAKRYVGTFGAMAKSFQFTEDQAFQMSTTLTQLAGDVASFYNLTQDEAYTKLKSVFTGETETLKDLGVVMTQTALDDFALRKGIGKTVQQMSEQEKVALRYQFVLERLSTASGDFLRTSDGWANQTRLLSLQFDQLKATLGQGLINVLTPAVKLLNTMIEQLQFVAESFKDWTETVFGDAGDSVESTANAAGDLANNLESVEKAAKKALAPFDEITKIGNGSATTGESSDIISSLIPSGDKNQENTQIGSNVQDNITPVLERIKEKLDELIEPLRDIDFSPAFESLEGLGNAFINLGATIKDALEWAWFNILAPLTEWAVEDAAPVAIDALSAAFAALDTALKPVLNGIDDLWVALEPLAEFVGDSVVLAFEDLKDMFDDVGVLFEKKSPEIEAILSNLGDLIEILWENVGPIFEGIRDAFRSIKEAKFDGIINSAEFLIDALKGVSEFLLGVFQGDWEKAWGGLKSIVISWVYGIVDSINIFLSGLEKALNFIIGAMNTISVEIPDWGIFGDLRGRRYGIQIDPVTIPRVPLPELAKGAVIPPNAPFAAVLGDQRNGRNLEAPEGLIRTIFQEEMAEFLGGMTGGFEALLEENRRLRTVVEGIEVGDTTIGQAANRYNRELNTSRGGA